MLAYVLNSNTLPRVKWCNKGRRGTLPQSVDSPWKIKIILRSKNGTPSNWKFLLIVLFGCPYMGLRQVNYTCKRGQRNSSEKIMANGGGRRVTKTVVAVGMWRKGPAAHEKQLGGGISSVNRHWTAGQQWWWQWWDMIGRGKTAMAAREMRWQWRQTSVSNWESSINKGIFAPWKSGPSRQDNPPVSWTSSKIFFKHLKSPGDPDRWRVDKMINGNGEMDGENDNNSVSKNGNFSFKSKSSSAKLQLVAIGNNLGKNKWPLQWWGGN